MSNYEDDWEADIDKDYLQEKQKYIPILKKLIEWEENNDNYKTWLDDKPFDTVWQISDVKINGSILHQLHLSGFIEKPYNSTNKTYYSLSDREEIKNILEKYNVNEDSIMQTKMHEFPQSEEELEGIFDDVVGYNDIKFLMKRAMTTQDITNILLVGPTGSAKTVFLMCINELEGAEFISGRPTSGPGVLDKMFESTPKYMLIDEMDDMNNGVQEVFSQYTETGIVDETKVGKDRKLKTNTKTFGSANEIDDIIDQINDRFLDLHFDPYTQDEFIEVCEHILPDKEDITKSEATTIAEEIWDMYKEGDVRKAIQVARLSRGDSEKVISVLKNYKDSSPNWTKGL